MTERYSEAVQVARDYYNSDDADNFYATIWGGEDIHIGLYHAPDEPIRDASQRTVKHMASLLDIKPEDAGLDIGSGYGGAARYLASNLGCSMVALNLSEKENERARMLSEQRGLSDKIQVIDGSFEQIPTTDNQFDMVWSQDAILHSGQRENVLQEVARVLKPEGRFIFTDPMQADDCPGDVLQPILDRIHLNSLASPGFYRTILTQLGFKEICFEERTDMLIRHYSRVLQETEKHQAALTQRVSADYVERMKQGLKHWINGGERGYLVWGIFLFQKDA
jgi:sarcosine/dimethylglycine N-methyltransferase